MGRFTAYDQNGRMVADFDKSDYDFLCRYGRTPEEVLDENAKLRKLVKNMVLSHHMELCPVCPFKDECFDGSHKYECIAENRLEAQARKLGIEVEQ